MSVKEYHKLVRDKIPEIIEASGKACKTEILSDEDYLKMLDAKLDEELAEYHQDQSLEELADLLEVLFTAAVARGYTITELERTRAKKAEERGGFGKKILLKEVSDSIDPNRPTVKLSLVMEAIEMADDNSTAYYDLEKQELIWYTEDFGYQQDEDDEVLEEMIEEGWRTRFFKLPDKFDINEYRFMEDFIYDEIPAGAIRDQFESAIRGRGTFRRFRNLAERLGVIDEWYDYKEKAQKKLAIEWCEENGFNYE